MLPVDQKESVRDGLPSPAPCTGPRRKSSSRRALLGLFVLLATSSTLYNLSSIRHADSSYSAPVVPLDAQSILAKCRSLQLKPGPPADFYSRAQSDRYQPGTGPVLIQNAKIWTGEVGGSEVLRGDVLLDKGIIKTIGHVSNDILGKYADIAIMDVKGYVSVLGLQDHLSHASIEALGSHQGSSTNKYSSG